ncbi:hypothetical protein [Bacillus sp. B15-48]|uniref:hypothetical protein n=1 Tax=Bacillus sp. B15-48 TaxID=1548601 RepID=UPI0031B883DC
MAVGWLQPLTTQFPLKLFQLYWPSGRNQSNISAEIQHGFFVLLFDIDYLPNENNMVTSVNGLDTKKNFNISYGGDSFF